jgi:hypothetical protein
VTSLWTCVQADRQPVPRGVLSPSLTIACYEAVADPSRLAPRSKPTHATVTIMNTIALELGIAIAAVGIALGVRCKVAILIPAIALVALFAAIVGIAQGDPFWSIILAIAISGTIIQVGYLAGILIGAIFALPEAPTSIIRAIIGLGLKPY